MSNQISILGNLQNGILIMNQNPIVFPTNPTMGMIVINNTDLFIYTSIAGITNWYPLVQRNLNPSNYAGKQTTLSNVWIVRHNLGTTDYYYQVQDANANVLTPLQLIPIDLNSFKLVFSAPITGNVLVISTTNLFIDQLAIGDGTNVQLTRADYEQLNFVAGTGVHIDFDNVGKSITISSTNNNIITNLTSEVTNLSVEIATEVSRAQTAEVINTTAISTLAAELNTLISSTTNTVPLDYGKITSSTNIVPTNNANQIIDSFPISIYRTAKYLVQISQNNNFQALELLCIHNGVTPYIMETNDLIIGSGFLATFDATITNGVFQLLVTPLLTGLTINIVRTSIVK